MLLQSWSHHSLLQWTRQWHSSHTRTSWAQVGSRENSSHHPLCTAHLNMICVVSHSCMVAEPVILELWCRVVMATTQEVEMLRRQLTAQIIEMRQLSSNTAMNAAITGLAEAVRSMGQSVSKPRPEDMRVGKPEPYAPGKDFDDWDFTFNGYAGTLDPAYPALLKAARESPTVVMATPPHEQQSATLLYLLTMLTQKGERKVVRKAGNNGFEAYRQLCLMYGTSDQEGSTGLFVQVMTYKFGSKIEDVEDRLNEFLGTGETIRRGERYRSRSRPSEKGVHHLEHAWASEDSSSAERGQAGKLQRITRGDWGLLEEQTHFQDEFSRKHTRWRSDESGCRLPQRERQRRIRQGQEGWQERKREPLRQRLRWNDSRALALRGWVSKLRKIWTQSCWLLLQADAQISGQRQGHG